MLRAVGIFLGWMVACGSAATFVAYLALILSPEVPPHAIARYLWLLDLPTATGAAFGGAIAVILLLKA